MQPFLPYGNPFSNELIVQWLVREVEEGMRKRWVGFIKIKVTAYLEG